MGKALGTKDRADPHVVALGLTLNCADQPCVIVTSESLNNRRLRKITGACKGLGLGCITLAELLEREVDGKGE